MPKEPYNINTINLLAVIPGGLKRTLKKNEQIYVSLADRKHVEDLLTKDGVGYSTFDHAFDVVLFVIY